MKEEPAAAAVVSTCANASFTFAVQTHSTSTSLSLSLSFSLGDSQPFEMYVDDLLESNLRVERARETRSGLEGHSGCRCRTRRA